MEGKVDKVPDRFRTKFKYFKSKKPPPDLSLASDLDQICADPRNRRVPCGNIQGDPSH